jgi:hypothetical protein
VEAELAESHPLLYPLFASVQTTLGCHGFANKTFSCLFVNTPAVYLLFFPNPVTSHRCTCCLYTFLLKLTVLFPLFLLQVSTPANHLIRWRFILGHFADWQGSGRQDVRDQVRHHDDDAGNSRRMCWKFCGDFMSFLFKAIAIRKV